LMKSDIRVVLSCSCCVVADIVSSKEGNFEKDIVVIFAAIIFKIVCVKRDVTMEAKR